MVEERFLTFVAKILEVEPGTITLDTVPDDVPEWDSLKHLQLSMEICDEYGVDISIDKITTVKKLGDFYKFVEQAQQ